jgi:hypothetical protein
VSDENGDEEPDGRHETPNERSDRNWNEMLQETRITQTGTQILSGFLLTIAFQPRFATLTPFQHVIYLSLVIAATLTTALALTPVYLHRRLFQRRQKAIVVQYGHRLLSWALAGLVVVMTGTVLLIFDVALGITGGVTAAALVLLTIITLGALPVRYARRSERKAVSR